MDHQTKVINVDENGHRLEDENREKVATNIKQDVDEITNDINELPDERYNETLRKIVENELNVPFEDCDVKIVPGSAKGDNYLGVVYRVTVSAPATSEKLNIIVKLPPQNQTRREQFKVRPCFLRESLFYDEVYPMYKKFQEEKGIDVAKEGFCEVPGVFASLTDEPLEGLFFEDLKASGFDMFDRLKSLTVDHVNLVMKSLGKMHAIAFALKDQKPEWMEKFKEMPDYFKNEGDKERQDGVEVWYKNLKLRAIASLEGHENEKLIEATRKFFDQSFAELYEKGADKKYAEPYAVITHGDCWNNNIMYRYDARGAPSDIRLLDFQIMRYSSTVCDLAYYIFCCTTKELRAKHYRSFLDLYYDTLADFILKLGSNPQQLFPREIFENHLVRFGNFGLTMATMTLPIFVTSGEDTPDLDELAEKIKNCEDNGGTYDGSDFDTSKSEDKYKERMIGVLEDMFELGYI